MKQIPDFRAYMKSTPKDSNYEPPAHIEELRQDIKKKLNAQKRRFTRRIRQGVIADKWVGTYVVGPFEFPLDFFLTSRWYPRRLQLPVAKDKESWRTAWQWWQGARSYRGIKAHIEKYGMRKPIWAEWFVNYDPREKKLLHRAYCLEEDESDWPFLILRTGNERLLMAWFEWGWETISTMVWIRDHGWDPAFSALLKVFVHNLVPKQYRGSRWINRKPDDKGVKLGKP